MPEHTADEFSCEPCAACRHAKAFHRPNNGPCFGELNRNALSRSDINLENLKERKEMGAECWCQSYETDLARGIDAILKDGDAAALAAATNAAVERRDALNAQQLLDWYLLKTIEGGSDPDWTRMVERSVVRLQSQGNFGGSFGGSLQPYPRRDAVLQGIAEGTMKYPSDFPSESRARVEAEKIRAGRDFDASKQSARWVSDVEALLRHYILRTFLAFAEEAQTRRLWPVEMTDSLCREFLRLLTIDANAEKGYDKAGHRLRDMISNWNGAILSEVEREFEKTPEWKQYQDVLLELAEVQISKKTGSSPDPQSTQSGPSNKRPAALLSKYRSELKRSILIQLTRNPVATDYEVCRGLDADGSVELPASWKSKREDRLFADAYLDRRRRHKVEISISRVRADLRKQGLLAQR